MRSMIGAALALAAIGVGVVPARAGEGGWLIPPVDAGIARPFEAPVSGWGAGHRGIDYLVAAGTSVRAAGTGEVTFAGKVGGAYAVAIDHGNGLKTTYSRLAEAFVVEGQAVGRGQWIGETDRAHPAHASGLHFGVVFEGDYADPADFLGSGDVTEAIHLVATDDSDISNGFEMAFARLGMRMRPCRTASGSVPRVAPNDNVAVVIAGISSRSEGGGDSPFLSFAEKLGYEESNIYRFSYRSLNGPRGHEPYSRADTGRSLLVGARRLGRLLTLIAAEKPGADVDILAHSQGGIIARAYLSGAARGWDDDVARVEHLVTLATPHAGARIAHLADDLREESLTGGLVVEAASLWARHGGPLPDPDGPAARELKTDSDLIRWLATEDVMYGTRVLALAVPDDLIVTANRAAMPGALNRVVPPEGLSVDDAPRTRPDHQFITEALDASRRIGEGPMGWIALAADVGPETARAVRAHLRIVESPYARLLAHTFLSDRLDPCPSGWDEWGTGAGQLVEAAEGYAGWAYGQVETLVAARMKVVPYYEAARIGRRILQSRDQ
ncbi:MAG: peptidoglycan DD-metalloendopeptidase family protein [Actinomycetota bacterium]